ncbi:hypothetical protein KJ763_00920 [Patescibacteria group bacterium]|nr:hypothetical protein [Patescibacteria group bacterium]
MLENHIYNLMLQLTQEHKSLWRIKNHYLKDSQECAECQNFWNKMAEDKENHVNELKELIKKHLS